MKSRSHKENAAAPQRETCLRAIEETSELERRSESHLYPLQFEPILEYRLWGGRRLADLLSALLPANGPIGEARVLSDHDDHLSLVASGPPKRQTIAQSLEHFSEEILGRHRA